MFAKLFGRKRAAAHEDSTKRVSSDHVARDKDDDEPAKQPPTKKIKTENTNAHEDRGPEVDPGTVILARQAVFSNHLLLENVSSFLNNHEELQFAACEIRLYVFFHNRAKTRFESILDAADPDQKSAFVLRVHRRAANALSVSDPSTESALGGLVSCRDKSHMV